MSLTPSDPAETPPEKPGLGDRWKALAGRLLRPFSKEPGQRASVPTILQMEAVECGAASLAMVLAHYGLWKPLEELRVACGVSRDGSKASNILKAARGYGLVARGFRKEPESLREMQMPVILHWNFNHFLVLEGFQGGKVHLADPAQGPVRVSEEELDESFTGVVLTFEKGPEFERGGSSPSLVRSLAPRLATSKIGLLFVVLAGLGLMIPGLLAPTFSQVYVDDILVRGLDSWLRPLLLVMGITAVVQIALGWLRQRYLLRLETKLALVTSAKFLWHVLRLPIEFYNQRYAGEIGSRVAINDKVAGLLSGELATTLLNLVVIVFYAALMVQYDVVLTVVSVSIALVNLAALRMVSRTRVDLNQRLLKDRGNMLGVAMGGLQTIETLKATGSEDDCFSRWAGQQAKVVNSSQRLAVATQLLSAFPPFLLALNTAVILGLGGLRVIDGHLSMGMLMAYQALMLAFINPVNRLVSLGGTLQEVEGDTNRLDDVLRAQPDRLYDVDAGVGEGEEGGPRAAAASPQPDGSSSAGIDSALVATGVFEIDEIDQPKLEGYLEIRDLVFGYSRLEKPLIRDYSLHLEPGMRVAMVGGSGCGKSTIARLVAGLYEHWKGEILFDGKRREEVPRQVLSNSVAFVDQDIFLFEGTIRDNLTLWDGTVRRTDLIRAARDACILDEITSRPGGFDSLVAEGGTNFSGGQRQRLEIARALVLNPTLLVLDEATSALDPTTEQIIDDNLRRRGVTCLIVAHRLSTIRDCDEIIVMDRGGITQRGNHEELKNRRGLYRRLIAAE